MNQRAGSVAPDGSPIDLYVALGDDTATATFLAPFLPKTGTILDIGAGVGRLADPLAEMGYTITALDESAAMLGHMRSATPWHTTVESALTPEPFDAAILASFLIDYRSADRISFLRACRRLVRPGADLFVQRQPPDWYDTVQERMPARGSGVQTGITQLRPLPGDRWAFTMTYRLGRQTWQHPVVTRRFADVDVAPDFAAAGFEFFGYLDERRSWIRGSAV